MRDLLVTAIVFSSLPLILFRPHVGILMWCWISFMNPHRLGWGFAYNFPFAQLVAGATIAGLVVSPETRRPPITRETIVLVLWVSWMLVTTCFALVSADAWIQWDRVWKIQLFTFLTLMLVRTLAHLDALVWITVASIGFYGVKGGLFTVATGGNNRVWGPPESFIGGNNETGLALIMVVPLMRYLQLNASRRWIRHGFSGAMLLSGVAIVGTHSRGALVGGAIMVFLLILKTRRRFLLTSLAAIIIPLGLSLMPAKWTARMRTIQTYEKDASVMGRVNAWSFAWNVARDRPLIGGGFEVFDRDLFKIYAANPRDFHDAHSVYFEVLGEQGFVGLFLFLSLGAFCWLSCSWIARHARPDPELKRLVDLGKMAQVSLVGYAASGAFLGLAYFDLYYTLVSMVVIAKAIVIERLAGLEEFGVERGFDSLTTTSFALAWLREKLRWWRRAPSSPRQID